MARGKKAVKVITSTRPIRYANGYGTVYLIDKTGMRRKPFVVKVPIGWDKPCKEGQKAKYKYKTIGYTETWEQGDSLLKEYHQKKMDISNLEFDISTTFLEVYNLALPRKLAGASKSTATSYEFGLKLCTPLFKMSVRDIKTAHMQKIIDNLRDEGKSTSTFRSVRKVCNLVMDYAIQNDITDKQYASFLDIGRSTETATKTPFTSHEIQTLFANDSVEYVGVILILIYTGMRLIEFLSLKTENIHFDQRYLITGSKTAAGKNRMIPISHKIEKYLKLLYNPNQKYLFCPFGKNTAVDKSTFRFTVFDVVMKRFKMKHTPHECRHTCVTLLDNAGANKVAIQKIIGHKGTDVTEQVYTHKSIDQLLEAIDLI